MKSSVFGKLGIACIAIAASLATVSSVYAGSTKCDGTPPACAPVLLDRCLGTQSCPVGGIPSGVCSCI